MARDQVRLHGPRGLKTAVGNAVFAFVLYLVFAGQLTSHEFLVAAALSAGVGAGMSWYCRGENRRFRLGTDHPYRYLRAIAELPLATARTGGALIAAIGGRIPPGTERVTFIHGSADDPRNNGRRATAVFAASLAPDSFVVRTPQHENLALIHHIVLKRTPPDSQWL